VIGCFANTATDAFALQNNTTGNNQVYSVRYEAVNAMLLTEFFKEHCTVKELKSAVAKQDATIAKQQKQIETLSAGLQKMSDQYEMSKPAPQLVCNNQ